MKMNLILEKIIGDKTLALVGRRIRMNCERPADFDKTESGKVYKVVKRAMPGTQEISNGVALVFVDKGYGEVLK